jgi:hypothetical protein
MQLSGGYRPLPPGSRSYLWILKVSMVEVLLRWMTVCSITSNEIFEPWTPNHVYQSTYFLFSDGNSDRVASS